MRYDVFVSYSHDDAHIAQDLYSRMTSAGLTCFIAEKDIAVATEWEPAVRDALRTSASVLLVITPRSIKRPWVMAEVGAAWALDKTLVPALAFVSPGDLIRPISKFQARIVETPTQIEHLIRELVALTSGGRRIEGQWRDPADDDTVFFKQSGSRVVGFYDMGTGDQKVGLYLGTISGRVLDYRWRWLNGQHQGLGRITLSEDGTRLSGDWWDEDEVGHVGYRRVSGEMPSWLTAKDFEAHSDFLDGLSS
jgi:hypothetical protein